MVDWSDLETAGASGKSPTTTKPHPNIGGASGGPTIDLHGADMGRQRASVQRGKTWGRTGFKGTRALVDAASSYSKVKFESTIPTIPSVGRSKQRRDHLLNYAISKNSTRAPCCYRLVLFSARPKVYLL